MLYILDTNILIHPHRITHPMDIYPTFWDKMSSILSQKDVLSIDKVKDEIYAHQDALSEWCKNNLQKTFWASTQVCISEYAQIQNWAQTKNYNDRALADFASSKNADPFIIAYALHIQNIQKKEIKIVTMETSSPESKKSIKIPDVCNDFNLNHINNNDFFRALGVRF